ncbi:MAG: BlaI/MecI/CopY family transcriptional regulator [Bacteroidales bacterium]
MKELTKAEEQIMQYLWKIEKGFLKDIVDQFADPKPAYTTVSTVIRVLVRKGFIRFNTYGKVHEYYPAISKDDYSKKFLKSWIGDFFNHSNKKFVSFFMQEENLDLTELEEIRKLIEEQIDKRKIK